MTADLVQALALLAAVAYVLRAIRHTIKENRP